MKMYRKTVKTIPEFKQRQDAIAKLHKLARQQRKMLLRMRRIDGRTAEAQELSMDVGTHELMMTQLIDELTPNIWFSLGR